MAQKPAVRPSWARGPARSAARRAGPAEPAAPPRAAVVFAHPHPQQGGTMHTKAVYQAAKALSGIGCVGAAVQLPRRRHAARARATKAAASSDDFRAGARLHGQRAIPAASSGPRGCRSARGSPSTAGAARQPRVGAPRHRAAGRRYDFSALKASTKPKFFVHGERDELFPLKTMREFYGQLPEPKELVVIDGADHLFDGKAQEVGEAVEDLLGISRPRRTDSDRGLPSFRGRAARRAIVAVLAMAICGERDERSSDRLGSAHRRRQGAGRARCGRRGRTTWRPRRSRQRWRAPGSSTRPRSTT